MLYYAFAKNPGFPPKADSVERHRQVGGFQLQAGLEYQDKNKRIHGLLGRGASMFFDTRLLVEYYESIGRMAEYY